MKKKRMIINPEYGLDFPQAERSPEYHYVMVSIKSEKMKVYHV